MRLPLTISLYILFASLVSAHYSQCRACDTNWCLCSDSKIECAWFQERTFQFFDGCNDYETLVLHPEESFQKKKSLFSKPKCDRRTLYKDFFHGLDDLKHLVIARPCVIEPGTFANLKSLKTVELHWKDRPLVLRDGDTPKTSGATPVLYKKSLADLPFKAELRVNKNTEALIVQEKVSLSCNYKELSRVLDRNAFYNRLKENRHVGLGPQDNSFQKDARQTDSTGQRIDRRSYNVPVDFRRSQSHAFPSGFRLEAQDDATSSDDVDSVFYHSVDNTEPDVAADTQHRKFRRAKSFDHSNMELFHMLPPPEQDSSPSPIAENLEDLQPDEEFVAVGEGTTTGNEAGRSLKTIMEWHEGSPVDNLECDPEFPSVPFDAVSRASSEDPAFEQFGIDGKPTKSFSDADFSKKPPAKSISSFTSSISGRDMAIQLLLPMPLDLVMELPPDISSCLTGSYLLTKDVVAILGNVPKPLSVIGNYGRSAFVEYDDWMI